VTHTPKDAGELLGTQAAAADVALGPYAAEHAVLHILLHSEDREAVYPWAMTYSEEHKSWIPFGKYFAPPRRSHASVGF